MHPGPEKEGEGGEEEGVMADGAVVEVRTFYVFRFLFAYFIPSGGTCKK